MSRILIIDDEPLVRMVIRNILERQGHTVMDAPDGRAGLALWRHTPSDLVLTDIFMPNIDGIEVIVQLTRVWPQAKIIAMIDAAGKGDLPFTIAPAVLELGAQRILVKPFTTQILLAAISAVLTSKESTSDDGFRTETPVPLKAVM